MPVKITQLPFEVTEKILSSLNCTDLFSARQTCTYLNDVGRSVQQSHLRLLQRQATEAVRRYCVIQDWRRGQAYDLRRLANGSSSLLKLAAMIEIVDAETRHLVRAGVLPTLPRDILEELHCAVKLATRRNPLVGRARLQRISRQLESYWRINTEKSLPPLDDTVLLHTFVDLMDCLEKTKLTCETTEYGIRVTCGLNTSLVFISPPIISKTELSSIKISNIRIFKYLPTCAGKHIVDLDSSGLSDRLAISDVTMEVACIPQSISILSQLKGVTATGFRLSANTNFGTVTLAMSYEAQKYFNSATA